jgi:predicted nucleotide-binding protein
MTDREKLEWLLSEADALVAHYVIPSTPAFQAWFSEAERFLIKRFGAESFEYKKLKATKFWPGTYSTRTDLVNKCEEGIVATKLIFKTYLAEMQEEALPPKSKVSYSFDKIFIVHGHDGELKQSVARIIEKQGLEAIILSEQANKGRTIIEKFEDYSDVGGAICLFTADDYGRAKKDEADNTRARQNVVLETGYFMGKLGRDHVVLLADKGIEMPSDLSGVVYTDTGKWEIDLLKELKAMGYAGIQF